MADINSFYSRKFVLLRFVVLFLTFFMKTALSDVLQSILWAPYNPFFNRLGESPRTVFEKDIIHFICPNTIDYPTQSRNEFQNSELYSSIHLVDKNGYDNCDANGGFEIKICNTPSDILSYKLVILTTQPLPSFPKLKPGQLYYFIDTSDGSKENVTSKVGGKCLTHNMKMKMYFCANESDPACPNGNRVSNGGWSSWGSCSNAGMQTRQCNNPIPSNGGIGCQGNATRPCVVATLSPTIIITTSTSSSSTAKQSNNNTTVPPYKERRVSNYSNGLGGLSVGAVVGIFLAVLICGIVLGILMSYIIAKNKSRKIPFVLRRKKQDPFTVDQFDISDLTHGKNAVDQFNRNSVASTAKMRPYSTYSNDTTLTTVPPYASYNDICDQADKDERLC